MKNRLLLFLMLATAGLTGTLHANVIVIPRNPDVNLDVKSHHVTVDIDRQHAVTEVEQVFVNPTDRQVEGRLLFPIPKDASVHQLSMSLDGKEMPAELLDEKKARNIYERIVRQRRDPALLQHLGQGAYQVRIFPIPPNAERRVRLSYTETLNREGGLSEYTYALSSDRASTDTARETSLDLTLKSDPPVQTVYSPTHEVDVHRRKGGRLVRVGFESTSGSPAPEFRLFYRVGNERFGMTSMTHREVGQDGTFSLFITPSMKYFRNRTLEKDVVFLLDTSGSMRERNKMEQARNAVRHCIESLDGQDRFNVISFSTVARSFREDLLDAMPEAKEAAKTFVDRLKPTGGTNIHDALRRAFDQRASTDTDRPLILVMMTDGNPTAGKIIEGKKLLNEVKTINRGNARIFAAGIGYDVKTGFLDQLTTDHGGDRTYIAPEESIEARISTLYDKIAHPVLSDVTLKIKGVDTYDHYPRKQNDLFLGSQAVVYGRYPEAGEGTVVLTGRRGDKSVRLEYDLTFPGRQSDHDFLPRAWAGAKIGHLLDEIRMHGERDELKDEIVRLSKRHGIVTPYTTYLILEEDAHRNLPEDMKDALSSSDLRENEAEYKKKAQGATSGDGGRDAQQGSEFSRRLQTEGWKPTHNDRRARTAVKQVGEKTFYKRRNAWHDHGFDPDRPVETVEFLSEEYFTLLEEHPQLKRYFSQGQNVAVAWNGKQYRVVN